MQDNKKINLICVVGPTASGKTALGVSLAEIFAGEVVSADSMQIYKGMDISTAKPTKSEMRNIPHHMIDFVDPANSYSVAEYVKQANSVIDDIAGRGKTPVLVGGTGLYVSSLLDNISFQEEPDDNSVREKLFKRAEEEGIDGLLSYLESFDPESAAVLSKQRNLKRTVRAIEVYEKTGKTFSQVNMESKKEPSRYNAAKIGLTCRDRQKLYEKINRRVDIMLENGLLAEAQKIYDLKNAETAVQAIGCKEFFPYFRGEKTIEECTETLKRETRRYAKRQLTWFRRDPETEWIFTDEYADSTGVLLAALDILRKKGYKSDVTV